MQERTAGGRCSWRSQLARIVQHETRLDFGRHRLRRRAQKLRCNVQMQMGDFESAWAQLQLIIDNIGVLSLLDIAFFRVQLAIAAFVAGELRG